MTRIIEALRARAERIKDADKGFTLIELLVVVIIIGILAAIAIPVYLGVQNNAKDSSVQSDVANLKIAVVSLQTSSGSAPAAFSSDNTSTKVKAVLPTTPDWAGAGATVGDNTYALKYTVSGSSYCVSGVSSTGTIFKATDTAGAAKSTAVCS